MLYTTFQEILKTSSVRVTVLLLKSKFLAIRSGNEGKISCCGQTPRYFYNTEEQHVGIVVCNTMTATARTEGWWFKSIARQIILRMRVLLRSYKTNSLLNFQTLCMKSRLTYILLPASAKIPPKMTCIMGKPCAFCKNWRDRLCVPVICKRLNSISWAFKSLDQKVKFFY